MVRTVEVDPARLDRWVAGFAARHDGVTRADVPGSFVLTGGDGTTVTGEPFDHARVGLVLVRRGGHAVGRDEGGDLVAQTCGTTYVQSRTKKGGWSQQRYARRRGNQADELVRAVRDHAVRLLVPAPVGESGLTAFALVVGGDRTLVAEVLDDPRLAGLAGLPRRELYDVPDPTRAVLDTAVARGRAVRVTVSDG